MNLYLFFGVYDGHGGDESAIFVQKNLLKVLLNEKEYNENTIQNGFMKTDELMSKEEAIFESFSGTTAVCCFIEVLDDEITLTCGNLGDSRCVFYKNDEVIPMSIDQKPNKPKEKKRIEDSGSCVMFGRVNGSLAVSRAFGDYRYKMKENLKPEEQSVIALPEVKQEKFKIDNKSLNLLVLACDGLWDVLKNEEVIEFIGKRIKDGEKDLEKIAKDIVTYAINDRKSQDNVTCIIVMFN